MSGEHFIPQSLLRAFGVKRGKKTYVVAYTYDRGTFAPPTDGIAAEGSFYSELDVEGATESLDKKITDYEQRLPTIFRQLREGPPEVDPVVVAELVTHLTVRNDHFRQAASVGGAELFGRLSDVIGNEDTARIILGVSGNEPSQPFAKQLQEMWERFGPLAKMTGITQEQFNILFFEAAKANFTSFYAEAAEPLQQTLGKIIDSAPDAAAKAQHRSLSENLSPPKRVERLAQFSWTIAVMLEPVVLPDCVAVGEDMEKGLLPLMLVDLEQLTSVFMPLAPDRLLIGSLKSAPEVPANINEVFARCSWDFFVARDRTSELESYRSLLRSTSNEFMSDTADEVIDEVLEKHRAQ